MVQYDQLADRWVMSQFSLRQGNYLQCVAISKTSDATGEWHRYAFLYNHFPDYPKLAVWPDAYYMTFNMFGATGQSFTRRARVRVRPVEDARRAAGHADLLQPDVVPLLPRLGPGGQDASAGRIAELCDDPLGRRRHESLQVQAELCHAGLVDVHRPNGDPGDRLHHRVSRAACRSPEPHRRSTLWATD